ncbi:Tetratricopeptide repeat-containing domain,Tetratricopeptide-like helical domain, partial [Cinara cedri]
MNTEKSVEDFKKAVELNPEFVLSIVQCYFAQYHHARRVSNELDVAKFLGKLNGFVNKYPDIADGFRLYALALSEKGSFVEADLLLKKAHEIHPDNVTFLVLR